MRETSVIIRTFNEAKHLPALFKALKEQDYQDFETIVVDSGSYDPTREIAAAHADRLIEIPQDNFTFGHSLNVGVEAAAGKFIAIISAHAFPSDARWLSRLVAPLRDEKTAMTYGRQIGDSRSKTGEFYDFLRTFRKERAPLTPPNFFANNANAAVRRDLWQTHHFDETLPGLEDAAWAKHFMEKGYQVMYEPEACVFHIHEETWPQVRRRYYREGLAAKWINVRRRRDLPLEALREMRSLFGDLWRSFGEGRLAGRAMEILRFRYEKLVGTCAGIWGAAGMQNPSARQQLFFNSIYKAVVIRGPGRAALEELRLPAVKPGEAAVRVAYQGVCATDLEVLEGTLGYYKSGLAKYPVVPGHELSGVVAAVGSRVDDLAVGDRVVVECIQGCGQCEACKVGFGIGCARRREVGVFGMDGGYADYVLTPRRYIHKLPEGVSLLAASLCEPLAVVLKGVRRLSACPGFTLRGMRCAVVGAGPIGHLMSQVLRLRGHSVTVFDQDAHRLSLLPKDLGRLQDLSALSQFDIVVEATGAQESLEAILNYTSPGVTVLLLGLPYARREFSFESLVGFDKAVIGSVGSSSEDFARALLELPKLDLASFHDGIYDLADYRKAWECVRTRKHLKTVLRVGGDAVDVAKDGAALDSTPYAAVGPGASSNNLS